MRVHVREVDVPVAPAEQVLHEPVQVRERPVERHRGVTPIPTGGSTKGTTLAFGDYGIRIRSEGVRLSAKQLTSVEDVLKRKLKPLKGAKIWMRVFPDIPVCIKVSTLFECYGRRGYISAVL